MHRRDGGRAAGHGAVSDARGRRSLILLARSIFTVTTPLTGVLKDPSGLNPYQLSRNRTLFLLEHLGGAGVSIWGLYGLERVEDGRVVPAPGTEDWRDIVGEVATRAQREIGGLLGVEDKGMTMTVHHRTAPGRASLAREWVERAAAESGLVVHPARMSYELRPDCTRQKSEDGGDLPPRLTEYRWERPSPVDAGKPR